MLTQKKIKEVVPQGELTSDQIRWISKNEEALREAFSLKYPSARNQFNLEVPSNIKPVERSLVVNSEGRVIFSTSMAYVCNITSQSLTAMGYPLN